MTDRLARKNQRPIAEAQDEEAFIAVNKGPFPRTHNVSVDFQGGLILGVALLTESTLIHGLEHAKGQAATVRMLGVVDLIMVFAFYFYRVWTRRPDAGQTVYLFLMLPFILTLVAVGLWGTIDMLVRG
jgi:hypothetical protein